MNIRGEHYRTIWPTDAHRSVTIIDQTALPFAFRTRLLRNAATVAEAIQTMQVRGAPLIGVAAAYGMALAMQTDASDASVERAHALLLATRPTAVNLAWALNRVRAALRTLSPSERPQAALQLAGQLADEDVAINQAMGEHGFGRIDALWRTRGGQGRINVLTHCNAGWLATVDWGTALAPVYRAFDAGIPIHVWVDETRPRNQGASLTAWELGQHGVPHTLIADNAGGHLMQHGHVDLCFVGTDRTTATGDVCNKIGTYLKALAANDNGVPFYVCAPSPSIDFSLTDGVQQIPIEERSEREVTHLWGLDDQGGVREVRVAPEGCRALNVGFDVTPARLVTELITERGCCRASSEGLAALFPERRIDTKRVR